MSTAKPQRVKESTVNTPVAEHILSSKSITKDEAESLLSQFITHHEEEQLKSAHTAIVDSAYATSLSQLKRIQRDLRGLPPLESVATPSVTPAPETNHKKFD